MARTGAENLEAQIVFFSAGAILLIGGCGKTEIYRARHHISHAGIDNNI